MNTSAKKRYFISVRVKLLVGFTLLFSLVFIAAAYAIYQLETDDMLAGIQAEMVNTLNGALPGLDGDDLQSLMADGQANQAGFSDDPRYMQQIAWFEQVNAIEPRAWLYTYVAGEAEGTLRYAADGWMRVDPERAAPFREQDTDEDMLDCLARPGVSLEPTTDRWGTWISACTPVRNARGEIVGALGIDFESLHVDELRGRILLNVGLVFLIGYAIGIALVYIISGLVSRPLLRLAHAAENIGKGHYKIDTSGINTGVIVDEIGTLADKFTIMAGKVGEREALLVAEVRNLRIQIDPSRRDQQVEEITTSEFFKDLKAQADAMRSRREARNDPQNKKEEGGTP